MDTCRELREGVINKLITLGGGGEGCAMDGLSELQRTSHTSPYKPCAAHADNSYIAVS